MLDVVQTGLDVVGLVPGLGEIADGINALIYTARGDYVNAALSAAAMIPIAGWAATGGKIVNKFVKTSSIFSHVTPKIVKQMERRGWSRGLIHEVVNNPFATRSATNRATGNAATAYFQKNGSYVVKDNTTNEIIQISNIRDPKLGSRCNNH